MIYNLALVNQLKRTIKTMFFLIGLFLTFNHIWFEII